TQDQEHVVKLAENRNQHLTVEIQSYKSEAQKQRRVIFSLEREREKYGQQATDSQQRYLQAVEEIRIRDLVIVDLQKKISEAETRLRQQQNLYEAVRADRNLYSKNLIETQDEISELRRKFRIMTHVIDQLRDEIKAKDEALVREHFERKQVVKERETLQQDLETARRQTAEAEHTIAAQMAEVAKLNHVITEADSERERQVKEYRVVVSERDILGTQLIRRNDELALLYEKIRLQQTTLSQGESQYSQRLADIRAFQLRSQDLGRQLSSLKKTAASVVPFRQEILRLQKELLDERGRVRALTEELQRPINVHRWRQLEGSDPSTFELLRKVQALQRRLIEKSEEIARRDAAIKDRDKLHSELRQVLARQPGPEIVHQAAEYRRQLKALQQRLKAVAAELAVYRAREGEARGEIHRLQAETAEIKKRYFEYKLRERRRVEVARGRRDDEGYALNPPTSDSGNRMIGGGFSLTDRGSSLRGQDGGGIVGGSTSAGAVGMAPEGEDEREAETS
ncbi:hypothetical protein KIPB_011212, partial [Kipferlia bialata]